MRYRVTTRITATVEQVWSVLADVERMPEWTPSMTSVRCLDGAPLGVGSRVRVKQPRLPASVYRVVEWNPRRSFCWVAKAPGIATRADHVLEPEPDGSVAATFELTQSGPLAPAFGALASGLVRRYVDTELAGAKAAAEALARES